MANKLTDELVRAIFNQKSYYNRGVEQMYGPDAANLRQAVFSHVEGRLMPKSKCGFSNVRSALYAVYGIELSCHARMENDLNNALRRQIGMEETP